MRKLAYPTLLVLMAISSGGCALIPFSEFDTASGPDTAAEQMDAGLQARILQARAERDLVLGMRRQDVKASWGTPSSVETAGAHRAGSERWVYHTGLASRWGLNSTRVVYFEDGEVVGWDTSR